MPKIKNNALTAAKIRAVGEPGYYSDGNGLTLRVDHRGNKAWYQRITVNGKRRNIGLGSYPKVSLAEARQAAIGNLAAIRNGTDPVAQRQQAREVASRPAIPTFVEASERVIELRRPTWSSERHAKQWEESLRIHADPVIGKKQVDDVTTADAMAVLTPIWVEKAETATRVRQRMETVFDYCVAQGWRTDNPASKAITKALPRRPRLKRHHPALHYWEVPSAVDLVRCSAADLATRLAFEFTVLTVARAGEARGATWAEIDLESATWVVPPERMKARREHRVPLARRTLDILVAAKDIGTEEGLIFPSKRSGKPLSNMAFSALLKRLGINAVPHGFRSSFKDWTIEQTGTPWAVGEAALAHNLGNSTEQAYARADLFERRRVLMEEWADFVLGGPENG